MYRNVYSEVLLMKCSEVEMGERKRAENQSNSLVGVVTNQVTSPYLSEMRGGAKVVNTALEVPHAKLWGWRDEKKKDEKNEVVNIIFMTLSWDAARLIVCNRTPGLRGLPRFSEASLSGRGTFGWRDVRREFSKRVG